MVKGKPGGKEEKVLRLVLPLPTLFLGRGVDRRLRKRLNSRGNIGKKTRKTFCAWAEKELLKSWL